MTGKMYPFPLSVGSIVSFKPDASPRLAGVPGKVSRIIARLEDGDYLVALEYDQPVRLGADRVTRVDALVSHLERHAA